MTTPINNSNSIQPLQLSFLSEFTDMKAFRKAFQIFIADKCIPYKMSRNEPDRFVKEKKK